MRAVISRFLPCCALVFALLAMLGAGAVVADEPIEKGAIQQDKNLLAGPPGASEGQLSGAALAADAVHGLSLRLSSDLPAPAEFSESERDLLRLTYRTLAGRDVQIDNQLALAEMLLQMERDSEQLREHAQRLGADKPALPPPAAASPVVERRAFDPIEFVGTLDVRLMVALGVLGALFLLLLAARYRRPAVRTSDFTSAGEHGENAEFAEDSLSSTEASDSELDQETVLSLDVPPDPHASRAPDRLPYRWQALLSRPSTIPESRQLTDLAEIILAVGQVQGTDELLRKFIEANPKLALELWIRLLEMYREQEKQSEFETLSVMLNRNFNVECVPWETVQPAEHLEMTLQLLPHIRDRVDESWGHPECLDYLLRLLLNNRNGERHGFSLAVTKEILILIDLIAAEAEGKKTYA